MNKTTSNNDGLILHNVLEFDGYCVLCNWAVNLVLQIDKAQKIKVKVLTEDPNVKNDTLYFWREGRRLEESEAVFAIINVIGGWPLLLNFFKIFPKKFNDYIYKWVSRNRYSLFGKNDFCRIPTEKDKSRFIT